MTLRIEDLAVGFRPDEVAVLKRAYDRVVRDVSRARAVDPSIEAHLGALVLAEAKRRLRLGLQLKNHRDTEVLAFMTTGLFFH